MDKIFCIIRGLVIYLFYLKQRLSHDRITVNAGYMAYITLLSLVPLTTVIFSVMSRFPAFEGTSETVQNFVISNFVPAAEGAITEALDAFVANTAQMTTVGASFLFVTAILLISSIDKNLNYIWRIDKKRRLVYSFSLYWMVLTLGPLLIGASIAVSSHVVSLKYLNNDAVNFLYSASPLFFSYMGFFGLYLLVPNIRIKISHALFGAFAGTTLFEISKGIFAYYITAFPSYHVIYGALAAVPILFVWIYLCWLIVLIGAEITASLGEEEQWRNSIESDLPKVVTQFVGVAIRSENASQKESVDTSFSRRENSDSSDPKSE